MKNEGAFERGIQITMAAALLIGAFFWTGGIWQIILFLLVCVVGTFAAVGFCPLYALIGKGGSCSIAKLTKGKIAFLSIYAFILLAVGFYLSMLIKR